MARRVGFLKRAGVRKTRLSIPSGQSPDGLASIFHSETGKTMANHCSAGFQACRIAGFQTCVPRLFNHAFERVCAPLFIRFFATLSQMAMKYPAQASGLGHPKPF
jgi:hypothetical protein